MKSFLRFFDQFFFGTGGEEEEVKPYFYGSLLFGILVALAVVVKMF